MGEHDVAAETSNPRANNLTVADPVMTIDYRDVVDGQSPVPDHSLHPTGTLKRRPQSHRWVWSVNVSLARK
jgi:hypothetical protein